MMKKVMAKTKTKTQTSKESISKETPIEFLASLAAVLAIGWFIMTFCVQAFAIPSSSMEDTLLVGDHVFVDRTQLAPKTAWLGPLVPYREIRRGDIVVFLSPQTPGLHVVKRIIGIPGDRIHLSNGVVYRNGERLEESYVLHDADNPRDYYRNNFPSVQPSVLDGLFDVWQSALPSHIEGGDIIVPPNAYFGMGDHRGVSLDSRYWGFIPRENVIGRPLFIYWSFETSEDRYTKTSAEDRVENLAHVVIHFFDGTRWKRTFRMVH